MVLAETTPSRSPALAYLKRAAIEARGSDHDIHKMGAVIVRGGCVLADSYWSGYLFLGLLLSGQGTMVGYQTCI
jgi:hypothetical protein